MSFLSPAGTHTLFRTSSVNGWRRCSTCLCSSSLWLALGDTSECTLEPDLEIGSGLQFKLP